VLEAGSQEYLMADFCPDIPAVLFEDELYFQYARASLQFHLSSEFGYAFSAFNVAVASTSFLVNIDNFLDNGKTSTTMARLEVESWVWYGIVMVIGMCFCTSLMHSLN
jgi:hypothetical protein